MEAALQEAPSTAAAWQCFLCLDPIRPCERPDSCCLRIGDPDGGLVRRSHAECADQNGLILEEGPSEWDLHDWACAPVG